YDAERSMSLVVDRIGKRRQIDINLRSWYLLKVCALDLGPWERPHNRCRNQEHGIGCEIPKEYKCIVGCTLGWIIIPILHGDCITVLVPFILAQAPNLNSPFTCNHVIIRVRLTRQGFAIKHVLHQPLSQVSFCLPVCSCDAACMEFAANRDILLP